MLGGAAFLMVDILGISYVTVMIACIPVAIMFYLGIFLRVDTEVVRLKQAGRLTEHAVDQVQSFPFGGWLKLVPVIVLVLLMGNGYTPQYAGFWAIVTVFAVDLAESRSAKLVFRNLLHGLSAGARASAVIVGIVAAAGIINGVMGTTGLALGLSSVLIEAAGGSKIVLLLLCAVVTIVLGMGLPTLLCYLLMAVLVAPALVQSGVPPLVAHLFIMYYASMSSITPPVGPDNFIAASIAGPPAHPLKVGMLACQLAAPAFFVPFIFAYHPGILFVLGFAWSDLLTLVGVVLGIYALNGSQSGVLLPSLMVESVGVRILLFATGMALLWPEWLSTILGCVVLLTIHLWLGAGRKIKAAAAV